MLGIESIGLATGSAHIDNIARAAQFDSSPEFMEKIGFLSLRRLGEGENCLSLCLAAYADLERELAANPAHAQTKLDTIDCLVVVTQNPDLGGLPHNAALVHGALGLPNEVAAFDISLGCSGYVYGLFALEAFMEKAGMTKGLLFTADAYSPHLDPTDKNTELLFGDAATCTLISTQPRYVLGKTLFATAGAKHAALYRQPDTTIFMNGRAVFNFTLSTVLPQIEACLLANGQTKDSVDFFLLHQASRYIVQNMARRLSIPDEKAPWLLDGVGNCVSSTLGFALAHILREKGQASPKTLLLSGFGVGLSWASTVLTAQESSYAYS